MNHQNEKIIPINIEEEMKTAYIDYSMSVIVSRALPDVRDGMKPVHRRVLFGMLDLGLGSSRAYKKSARIVGEVLGKYHPHGDSSVYDTMVRMAQEWSMRYMLVDGQGNFGSIDNDPPAAMRYTEARMRKLAEDMLADIDKNTVNFRPNFDESLQEPEVLPAKIPNLLINGASGIAVGMATNMAPHNLSEVIDGIIAYIDNHEIEIEQLMEHVKAPDFPTGGIIYGYDGVKSAFETGRGRIVMRSKAHFEETKTGREQIVITEIPYQTSPGAVLVRTSSLVEEKVLDGISDARDESGRSGLRIVFDLKKDAIPNIVLNKLFKYTPLQSSFSVNNIALVKGRPKLLNLKDMIVHFVDHRHEVVVKRTEYELEEAKKRAHILEGLIIALDNLDAVIALIRGSKSPEIAREGLISQFGLSDIQAKAILDMRLQRLTGLEMEKIREEYAELMDLIKSLEDILANKSKRMGIIKEELIETKSRHGDTRRSTIEYSANDLNIEDLIPNEQVVLTISHMGYIKRTSLEEYRAQGRGGVGNKGVRHRDEDFTEHLFIANSHNYMLYFTELGRCFWQKVYEIPEGGKNTKGRAIQNLIDIPKEDKIKAYVTVANLKDEDYLDNHYIIMCTKNGIVKKSSLRNYSRPRSNGINAITIREGDELLEAKLTDGNKDIMLAKKTGKTIRFDENDARSMGRTASGVTGVKLENKNDEVVGMITIADKENDSILVVSSKGYGKRTNIQEYSRIKRGGKGVKTLSITDKTGDLIGLKNVNEDDDLMIILKSGMAIRTPIEGIREMGRSTQGVRLMKLKENDEIAAVAKVVKQEDESPVDSIENEEKE
ncbi:MAG: DNA gyrase subunit A [Bacteroidetes bacterium TMED39]|nr:MAG: DNA gyrase subunit A [Bacteroidetes bacterium TMED39]|tara:strand:- start:1452 stop:3944 length:2493 start_codon:yes stop_codon:yes gene_type:complete